MLKILPIKALNFSGHIEVQLCTKWSLEIYSAPQDVHYKCIFRLVEHMPKCCQIELRKNCVLSNNRCNVYNIHWCDGGSTFSPSTAFSYGEGRISAVKQLKGNANTRQLEERTNRKDAECNCSQWAFGENFHNHW